MGKQTNLSGFINLRPLKQGGMGKLYLADRLGSGGFKKTFVIKKLGDHLKDNPQAKKLLEREIEIQSLLNHPNIVGLQDVFTQHGEIFLALDLVQGVSLADLLTALNPSIEISESQILLIISDALQGLAYLHDLKSIQQEPLELCHRDLNPGNLLLGTNGWTKLTDFGLSKSRETPNHTQLGTIKGQLRFFAPERIQGHEADRRADLYSLCAVLWEMFFQTPLITAKSPYATLQAINNQRHPKIFPSHRQPSPLMEHLLQKGLEPNPQNRFNNAQQMLELIANNTGCALPPKRSKLGELAEKIQAGKPILDQNPRNRGQAARLPEVHPKIRGNWMARFFVGVLGIVFSVPLMLWQLFFRSYPTKGFRKTFAPRPRKGRSSQVRGDVSASGNAHMAR